MNGLRVCRCPAAKAVPTLLLPMRQLRRRREGAGGGSGSSTIAARAGGPLALAGLLPGLEKLGDVSPPQVPPAVSEKLAEEGVALVVGLAFGYCLLEYFPSGRSSGPRDKRIKLGSSEAAGEGDGSDGGDGESKKRRRGGGTLVGGLSSLPWFLILITLLVSSSFQKLLLEDSLLMY